MPEFDVDATRIPVFEISEEYLFKYYFEGEDLFEELEAFYNWDEYRFEVPKDDFEEVRLVLAEHFYELDVVEDLEPYCVVKETYTEHAEILRRSVLTWTRRGYHFFLMKDELAVEHAIERGATPVADIDLVLGI